MKEGDILFYKGDYNDGDGCDWVGIFSHIGNEGKTIFDKFSVTVYGEVYTPPAQYMRQGSHPLGSLSEFDAIRPATEEEQKVLFKALADRDYRWNADEMKLEKIDNPTNKFKQFHYGDFIYVKTIGCCKDNEWLSIFRANSPDEILSLVDLDLETRHFYTGPEEPGGRLVYHKDVREKRLMTPEEKEIMVQELARRGYTWNEEKRELEVLKKEHKFKPFEKVLVRDRDTNPWHADLFGYVEEDNDTNYKFRTISSWYKQCIPYEGNEKLLGTTNKPE